MCSPNAFAREFEQKIEKWELTHREPHAQPILFQGNKKKRIKRGKGHGEPHAHPIYLHKSLKKGD